MRNELLTCSGKIRTRQLNKEPLNKEGANEIFSFAADAA